MLFFWCVGSQHIKNKLEHRSQKLKLEWILFPFFSALHFSWAFRMTPIASEKRANQRMLEWNSRTWHKNQDSTDVYNSILNPTHEDFQAKRVLTAIWCFENENSFLAFVKKSAHRISSSGRYQSTNLLMLLCQQCQSNCHLGSLACWTESPIHSISGNFGYELLSPIKRSAFARQHRDGHMQRTTGVSRFCRKTLQNSLESTKFQIKRPH